MTAEEKNTAESNVKAAFIPDFDYDALVAEITNADAIKAKFHATTVGYEKIQLFGSSMPTMMAMWCHGEGAAVA
ncbi:MAG TPA: hypothetical protein VNS12_06420 [Pelagibacterium sp.]|uniref:hypothetical protein n=1 Tax=Pelagibacterium sp. TaxID=1967288 RepID=UPI002B942ECE|nr:hypothetical protein [Pelagibacterium sp.]HWJ87685.1 hypothetical protein [Pelagibacterium sp.]